MHLVTLLATVWSCLIISASHGAGVSDLLKQPEAWFRTPGAKAKAANVLSHQSEAGSWPKNRDTSAVLFEGDRKSLKGTFDNGGTTDELRFLARMIQVTNDLAYLRAFDRGFDHILQAQYPNGGWPQSYPPGPQYHRHITFNDNAMARIMIFLREVGRGSDYAWVQSTRRERALAAFDRGIDCILKCQVKVNGQKTVWCAQHDELTLEPRSARTYELVSLSGSESVGLLRLLMSLEKPSPAVVEAVDAGVAYLSSVKLSGFKVVQEKDPLSPKGWNKVVVSDRAAPPLWARFYEISTSKPMFVDRDGVPKYALAEIGYERRNGYAWYGDWPKLLIEKDYPAWKAKLR